MSGFKTTSIFGSLINYCICRTVMDKLGIYPDYLAVLGDDIDLGFNKSVDIDAIYREYDLINFPIAKDKTKHCKGINVVTDFL